MRVLVGGGWVWGGGGGAGINTIIIVIIAIFVVICSDGTLSRNPHTDGKYQCGMGGGKCILYGTCIYIYMGGLQWVKRPFRVGEALRSLEFFGVDALFLGIIMILSVACVCFPPLPPLSVSLFWRILSVGSGFCVQFLCGSWFVFTINRADF